MNFAKLIERFGENVTVTEITRYLNDRGDAVESGSDVIVPGIIFPRTSAATFFPEAVISECDAIGYFSGSAHLDDGNKITWNDEKYVISGPPKTFKYKGDVMLVSVDLNREVG